MGLLTHCFVPRGGFLYTVIVPGGSFLPPSSRVPAVCPGGMVLDEIDSCITTTRSGALRKVINGRLPICDSTALLTGL